ncbi:MAG: YbhB/YbcL family Raf kinase inhibitor-like protein [Candidatus Velamenicoccus archaeovorus]
MKFHAYRASSKFLTFGKPAANGLRLHPLVGFYLAVLMVACSGGGAMALELKSPAFSNGSKIPPQYTCEGRDVSPHLQWSSVPDGTKSFALISDDPDAPSKIWVHWVIYNIPAEARELPQGFPHDASLPDGICQGINDSGETGYGGPCPPPGKPHRYYFKLYALDRALEIKGAATKEKLLEAMKGHVLGETVLMGTYER